MRTHPSARTFASLVTALFLAAAFTNASAAPRKKPAQDSSKVEVAVINGKRLTLADVEKRIKEMPPAVQIRVRKDMEKFLDGLVQAELLYQEAKRRKLARLPEVKERLLRAERRIMVNEIIVREVQKKVSFTDEELRKFFDENKEQFRRKESVTLSHIVVKSDKEAWDAVASLRRGASFADIARSHSIVEATRDAGGMMGTVSRGQLEKKLEDVAFTLPIGQISDPIKTSLGWQIIRVTERSDAAPAVFEDVKEDVAQILREVRQRTRYDAFVKELRSKGKVVIHPERVK